MPKIEDIQEENREEKNSTSENVNENFSKEQTIEKTKPEIQNSQLQIKEMEVHKHPHNVMHKKNWKEYLLEFLMIFFAVTLGFFAEGYREYLGDRHKESENMQGLLKDVRNDSVILQANLIEIINQNKGLD